MKAKVSLLISAYKAERFIEQKLDNLAEIVTHIQPIFICLKGSTTHELILEQVRSYHEKWVNPVLMVTNVIPPLYEAWNYCLSRATAGYVSSSNTDDLVSPWAYDYLLSGIGNNDFCYGQMTVVDQVSGRQVQTDIRKTSIMEMAYGCYFGPFPIWRIDLHTRFGLFDESYQSAGDYEFFVRCMFGGAKVTYILQNVGTFLKRPDAISSPSGAGPREALRILRKYYGR